jgi:phage host-nuclease inhibitor protein Gam
MTQISDWKDINNTLKRLVEIKVATDKINGEITIRTNEIIKEASDKIAPLDVERAALEKQVELYCAANKHEFIEKRTKDFDFGSVSYKVSTSVPIPRDKKKVEVLLKAIKAYKLPDCIAYEEKPDKEALRELDDATLAKLGLKRKIEDNFRIDLRIEKIADTTEATA